ncbi:MAG: hypothetical protein QM648_04960 [Solirubrobacterales bacterium]
MTLLEDLLTRGVDDWVSASELMAVSGDIGAQSDEDRRTIAIGVATHAILEGLVEPGGVTNDGFVPWAIPPSEAVIRMAREWLERDDPDVIPGELFWLRNTDSGDRMGRHVLSEDGPEFVG